MKRRPPAAAAMASECLCFRARRVSRALTRLFDSAFRPLGIQTTQLLLLNAIQGGGANGAAMGPLADALGMDRTTLSRNLRPLERSGLIRVARAAADARVRLVLLTPAGRRLMSAALPLWRRAHRRLVGAMGARRASELLERLDAVLRAAAVGTVPAR